MFNLLILCESMFTKKLSLITFIIFLNISFTGFSQETVYLVEQANDYFKSGRYWDSFFLYRDIAKTEEYKGDYQIESQIKNSSHAMYLKKRYQDFRALRKFELAKQNLRSVIELNPTDPNRGDIPHITLEEAEYLQRMAYRQRNSSTTADMLNKAIKLYYQAAKEGLLDDTWKSGVKLCEYAINKLPADSRTPETALGLDLNKPKSSGSEYQRTVEVIK